MRTIYLVVLVLLAAGASPAAAGGKQTRYIGIHPVPKSAGGGVCYIEGPHVHIFAANKVEYRDHRNHNYFVGDPVAYGYDGPRHAYKGHHPIHVHAVVGDSEEDEEFCYLDGPHYHNFTPAPAIEADFKDSTLTVRYRPTSAGTDGATLTVSGTPGDTATAVFSAVSIP